MLGSTDSYARVPYFFSDQYDVGMEYTGHATDWDRIVLPGVDAHRNHLGAMRSAVSRRRDARHRSDDPRR